MRNNDFVDECYSGKNLDLLKNIALVIPTYDRNYYLSRCLWYHAHFPFGQIIVADSSHDDKKAINKKTINTIENIFGMKILYLEYEPETDVYGRDISKKWIDAKKHVNLEYLQVCTDKQFIIPTATVECIVYLNQHPDFANAEGKGLLLAKNLTKNDVYTSWNSGETQDSESPVKRFLEAETKGNDQFCIQRTDVEKKISTCLEKNALYDIRFSETATEYFKSLFGKSHRNNDIIGFVRDVTKNYSFNKEKKANESSFYKYPHHSLYPEEEYTNLLITFKKVCFDILGDDLDSRENELISEYIEQIMDLRYGKTPIQNKMLFTDSLLLIWNQFPRTLQNLIINKLHLVSGKYAVPKLRKAELTREVKLIGKLVSVTNCLYNTDQSVLVLFE